MVERARPAAEPRRKGESDYEHRMRLASNRDTVKHARRTIGRAWREADELGGRLEFSIG